MCRPAAGSPSASRSRSPRSAPGWCWLLRPWLDDYTIIPLYLACVALPAYALSNVQDGISRSHDWVALGIVPTYIVRQMLLTILMGGAFSPACRSMPSPR